MEVNQPGYAAEEATGALVRFKRPEAKCCIVGY